MAAYPTPIEEPQKLVDSTSFYLSFNISVRGQFPQQANIAVFMGGIRTDASIRPSSNAPYCSELEECWFQVYPSKRYTVAFGPTSFEQSIHSVADSVVRLCEIRVEEAGRTDEIIPRSTDFSIVLTALPESGDTTGLD